MTVGALIALLQVLVTLGLFRSKKPDKPDLMVLRVLGIKIKTCNRRVLICRRNNAVDDLTRSQINSKRAVC